MNQTSFANGTMQGYVNASYGTLQAKAKNSYDAGEAPAVSTAKPGMVIENLPLSVEGVIWLAALAAVTAQAMHHALRHKFVLRSEPCSESQSTRPK